jgi:preprotein translocase subunit Sec63
MTSKEIMQAKEMLALPDRASLKEIKSQYRRLLKKWHPDTCKHVDTRQCHKMVQEINHSYSIIMEYCTEYKFSFVREELLSSTDENWWDERFGHDPLWGRENP